MARMSLSQAAQSLAGKQPVQPVPLVGNPYGLSPALAPQVAASAVPARRMSPLPPTPGSNAYRVAPAGTLYNPAGQRDGRAIGVPYGPGAYPVINTHNPTMVVLPPRLDLFSHMQNDYANFYRNIMPLITQMAQRAMQQGAKAARPKGAGGPAKPKTPPAPATMPKEPAFATYGQFPARWYPGMQMGPNLDRDSFGLMHPVDPYWDKFRAANPPKQGSPAQSSQPAGRPQADTSGAYGAAGFGVTEPTPLLQEGTFRNRWTWVDPSSVEPIPLLPEGTFPNRWTQGVLPGEPLNVRQFQDILKGK